DDCQGLTATTNIQTIPKVKMYTSISSWLVQGAPSELMAPYHISPSRDASLLASEVKTFPMPPEALKIEMNPMVPPIMKTKNMIKSVTITPFDPDKIVNRLKAAQVIRIAQNPLIPVTVSSTKEIPRVTATR